MEFRYLGPERLKVSAIGYGCPTFQGRLPPDAERRAIDVLHRAVDLGITYIDTADHNAGNNEELLSRAMAEGSWRQKVVLATKVGNRRSNPSPDGRIFDNRPAYIRLALEQSLQRLGTEYVDLLYLHRVDPEVPIEDSIGAMTDLVREGKVRHIGVSEAGPNTLRRAAATHPIAALESEYSLLTRDYEQDTIPACREMGIGFVAYYPTGRGFLAGKFGSPADFSPADVNKSPRFHPEHVERNLQLLSSFTACAVNKGCTPAQLALAWLLSQGDFFVPIPGTTSLAHLEENTQSIEIQLTEEEKRKLDDLFAPANVSGERGRTEGLNA